MRSIKATPHYFAALNELNVLVKERKRFERVLSGKGLDEATRNLINNGLNANKRRTAALVERMEQRSF